MQTTEIIFMALGGATAIAAETGDPVQTVHSWKSKGSIPRWRRPSLLEVARRKSVCLPNEAIQYLMGASAQPMPLEA